MDNIKLRKALVHNINILKNCHIFDGNLPYTILYFSISKSTWSELTGLFYQGFVKKHLRFKF